MTRPLTRVEIYELINGRRLAERSTLGTRIEEDALTTRRTEDGQLRACES